MSHLRILLLIDVYNYIFLKRQKHIPNWRKKLNIPTLQTQQKIEFLTKQNTGIAKSWTIATVEFVLFKHTSHIFGVRSLNCIFCRRLKKNDRKRNSDSLLGKRSIKKTPVVCLNRQKTPYINNQWEQILQWSFGKSSWERKIDEWILQQNELRVSIFLYYGLPLCIIFIAWILFPLTYFVE